MEEPSEQLMDDMAGSDEAELAEEFEDDPKRLVARQKQIDFGKNTIGYENYLKAVPKERRRKFGPLHDPPTPDITKKYSKKTWDGIVKAWRRHLHKFDDIKPNDDDVAPDTTTPVEPGSTSGAGTVPLQVGSGPDVPVGGGSRATRRWHRGKGVAKPQKHTPDMQHNRQQQEGQTLEASPAAMQQQKQPDLQKEGVHDRERDSRRDELYHGGAPGRQRSHVSSNIRHRDRFHDENNKGASRVDRHGRPQGSERLVTDSSRGLHGGRELGSSSDRWRDSKGHHTSVDRRGKWEAPGRRRSSRDDRADRDKSSRGYPEGSQQQQQGHGEREQDVWQYQGRPAGRSWADEVDQADADDAAAGGDVGMLSEGEVDPRDGSSSSPTREARRSSRPHSRGQLTPAKRSSSQGRLDRRPLKSSH